MCTCGVCGEGEERKKMSAAETLMKKSKGKPEWGGGWGRGDVSDRQSGHGSVTLTSVCLHLSFTVMLTATLNYADDATAL